jgi:hypothetical protein
MTTLPRTLATVTTITMVLIACAGQPSEESLARDQAVRDFVEVRDLVEADRARVSDRDGWTEITARYIIYRSRNAYLFEFYQPCYALRDNTRIVADVRAEPNLIRARFDTLRGCRIDRIYPLTEAEAAELKAIGEAPGERN